jgi:hypothetical protein
MCLEFQTASSAMKTEAVVFSGTLEFISWYHIQEDSLEKYLLVLLSGTHRFVTVR